MTGGDCSGYTGMSCDCSYRKGGCYITRLPPASAACNCKYRGFWTCSGEVTRCRDPNSPYCTSPGFNQPTCQQGGGDCGAY
ncbi:hypothetical protein GPECTOR_45g167 [Gonium pectorale]|uniref:Uncharacterized protein n=1 Tax=Gonium pectorale TaxID=33097 RepID=A0A150G8X6_GONPE|nr:hypothetical protein GPECTOR_45g167 [Gonium pectorale]|eukprot:KXZ46297.1 hypothetical protein GPECTOR_45g167 [Gonium pectorale]